MKKIILLFCCIISIAFNSFAQCNCSNPVNQCCCDDHGTIATTLGGTINCNSDPYKLVFFDEFTGNTLNTSKWFTYWPTWPAYDDDSPFSRTHDEHTVPAEYKELQIYRDANVIVSNGKVKLRAKLDPGTWKSIIKNYTSGYLQAKTPFKWGKVEVRFKLPPGKGLWPGIWLFGIGQNSGGIDVDQEIDIIEHCGEEPDVLNTTYHYNDKTNSCDAAHSPLGQNSVDFTTGFHTITCEFNLQFIKVVVDGTVVRYDTRVRTFAGQPFSCGQNVPPGTYVFSNFMPDIYQSLIINLALSAHGSYCGGVDNSTPLPADMIIDYVRVWQQTIQPGLVDLCGTRSFVDNDDIICQGDLKTFSVTGGHGELDWSVSPNLEIVNISDNSVTIKAQPNINGVDGHIYLTETNSPCGTNWAIDKLIHIGLPSPPIITSLGCGNGYDIESQSSFNYTWETNSGMGFPLINGGGIGNPNANNIAGYFANFIPNATNKYCIPYTITQHNVCGSTTSSGFIRNNCIPYNGPLSLLCERVIDPINMEDFGEHLSVFPNPTSGHININFSDHYNVLVRECKIYNMMRGSIVNELEAVESSNYITCSEWERGDYMIFLKVETGQTIARIITLQ